MQSTRTNRSSFLRTTTSLGIFASLALIAPLAHALQDAPAKAPAAAPATAPTATDEAAKPKVDLPKATDLIAKAGEAVGGKDAWSKVKSIEMTGTMEIPAANMKGKMTTKALAPNLMVTMMELPGFGSVRQGFDGTTAWAVDPSSGPRLVEGGEREMIAREASFLKEFELEKLWTSLETVGEGQFAGVDCWKVSAKRGDESATLWFEKATGLARGSSMTVDTQFGKIPVTSEILEYRDFNGLKVGSRTEVKQMGQKMVSTIETVVFDQVDPKDAELPADVKALLEPEPADEDGDEDADADAKPAAPAAPAAPATPAAPKA